MGSCVHPTLGLGYLPSLGDRSCAIPNILLCLPAHQSSHLPKEQEPAGASLKGMRRLRAPARLPPTDVPVPEHPQVRDGER